ncbi:SAGA-associated factor 29 isoform X2 [Mauremys mutica]|uniref:SAGA-associated factor 29 isoform X2 n=2 Tax=Mauremys TaxID=74925 RepID=UPI001D1660A5|nr:SAGA-associated factor 29 isoform X2 [Mauremys mutica]
MRRCDLQTQQATRPCSHLATNEKTKAHAWETLEHPETTCPKRLRTTASMRSAILSPCTAPEPPRCRQRLPRSSSGLATMALVSADSRIAELLGELHQLIKQTQEERSRSEHNLVNIQKTHERMQTENKISPYYRTKLRGLYTTAKADAEAECNILRKALDKIAEIKSLLEERRIAAKIAGLYNDSEPPRKTMRRGVLMTLLQQSAMTLPLWIGKPGDRPPPLCGAIPAASDYVAKPGDKVAARVKAVDGDEQWILAEVVSYSHATNKYEVDDIDEEGKERHTLSRRRIIPLPQWKANPETDPEALFQKDQLVLALYPQTTCFYRALIHAPPQRPQDDYSVLFEDTSYADGYSPPLNVAQRYVVACKETKKK